MAAVDCDLHWYHMYGIQLMVVFDVCSIDVLESRVLRKIKSGEAPLWVGGDYIKETIDITHKLHRDLGFYVNVPVSIMQERQISSTGIPRARSTVLVKSESVDPYKFVEFAMLPLRNDACSSLSR